jgi:hypothetical protein
MQEDLGCHIIDVVTWLFGAPSSVLTYGISSIRSGQIYGGDDISDVMMDWRPRNRIGHIHMSRVGHDYTQILAITARDGHIILDGSTLVHMDSRGCKISHITHEFTEKQVIRSMVRSFGDWATGKSTDFSCSLENLAETVSTVDAVRSSLVTRKVHTPLIPSTTRLSRTINKDTPFRSLLGSASAGYSTLASSRKSDQRFPLSSGKYVPAVTLGTRRAQWPGQVYQAVLAGLEAGYRSIDTAQSSGNEHEIGDAISDSGIPRHEILITTKLQNSWHTRAMEALEISLNALKMEYVDFYLMV